MSAKNGGRRPPLQKTSSLYFAIISGFPSDTSILVVAPDAHGFERYSCLGVDLSRVSIPRSRSMYDYRNIFGRRGCPAHHSSRVTLSGAGSVRGALVSIASHVAHALGAAQEIENVRHFRLRRLNQRLHRKFGRARLERERNNVHALAAKNIHQAASGDGISFCLEFE